MQVLVAGFETRDELHGALRSASAEHSMFLSGEYPLTAGERVLVRLSAPGLEPGVFVEGVVQNRRVRKPANERAAETIGLDVQLLPQERAPFAFVRSWAAGRCGVSGRSSWRYPAQMKAHVQVLAAVRTTGKLLHGSTVNVSETGVMLSVSRPLPALAPVVIMLEMDNTLRDFEARIVWATDTHAGIRFALTSADERMHWARLVASVREGFETRQSYPSLRPSSQPR